MANFKKGIALALVATTAFTFAPVSTLGLNTTVVAQAATATKEFKLDVAGATSKGAVAVDLTKGLYQVTADNNNGFSTIEAKPTTNGAVTAVTGTDVDVLNHAKDLKGDAASVKGLFTLTDATTVTFEFVTNGRAENAGSTTYTITRVVDKDGIKDNTVIATYKVTTIANSAAGVTGLTRVATTPAGTPVITGTSKKNADGTVSYYVPYGNKETVKVTGYNDFKGASKTDATKYTWSTSNSGIVTLSTADSVSNSGKNDQATLEAVSAGTATITVNAVKTVNNADVVVATSTYNVVVEKSTANVQKIRYANPNPTGKTDKYLGVFGPADSETFAQGYVDLDTLVNKSATLLVEASSSDITYKTEDPAVATVDANGTITAVGKGTTKIDVFASATGTAAAEMKQITVKVATLASDIITVKNGEKKLAPTDQVDLDLSTSTAANAVKSAQLVATSAAGNTDFTYALFSDADAKTAIAANGNNVASVSSTGLVTAGTADGTVYVKVSTKDSANGTIKGGSTIVKVVVNKLPADTVSIDPVVLDLTNNKTVTLAPVAGNANAIFSYEVKAENDGENAAIVDKSGNKLTAKTVGKATLVVTEAATATTRATTVKTTITVGNVEKKASDLTVANTSVVAKVGETVELGAKATNPVTYTVADSSIATVSETGVVTAVKAGQTTVTVSAAGSDTMNAASITVPVVVTEDAKPVVVAKPAKVTGVKVANVKGAKVKVSFKKSAKAAGYVVTYKIGKKTYKKTITSTSTKLSVKKGAKVTVTVKAFNYKDGNVKQFGAASKAVSKKTDKK